MKICILGDSVAKGVVLDEQNNRYVNGKHGFGAELEESGLEVENFSVFGCTVEKGLKLEHRHEVKIQTADVVLLELGGNDSDFKWKEIAETPNSEHFPNTTIESYKEQYMNIIDSIKKLGAKPILMNLPPIDAERYFNWFSKDYTDIEKENVISWLGGDIERIHYWHAMYNEQIEIIAKKMNSQWCDIRSGFGGKSRYRSLLCMDGIHPNELGQHIIFSTVKNILV